MRTLKIVRAERKTKVYFYDSSWYHQIPIMLKRSTSMVTRNHVVFVDCPAEFIDAFVSCQNRLSPLDDAAIGQLRVVVTLDLTNQQLSVFGSDPAPILLLSALKRQLALGPLQVRGHSICLACVRHWSMTADWEGSRYTASEASVDLGTIEIAVQLLSQAISTFKCTGTITDLETSISLFDLESGKSTRHAIFPRRDCPSCSGLQDKRFRSVESHCSFLTGIISKLSCTRQMTGGAFFAHALCVGPIPRAASTRAFGLRNAWGRGISRDEALASCIGEALEGYSAAYRGDETVTRGALHELPRAIDPRSILLISQDQYQNRQDRNSFLPERHRIPEEFDPSRAIDWLEGVELVNNQPALIPAASCLLGYPFRANEPRFAIADTVGCACRQYAADALAIALLELIERDASAIWWYNQIRRPAVRLSSFNSPAVLAVEAAQRKMGRDLVLLDVTTDIAIPAYVAISTKDGEETLFGAAAHVSPRIAACKAVTEVAQFWFCLQRAQMPSDFQAWIRNCKTRDHPYLQPESEIECAPEPPAMSSSELVETCVRHLSRRGLQAIKVDIRRTDVSLCCVRAFVPGLRSLYNRKAPGRLFDVPVQLGWLPSPRTEAELNRICAPPGL